tara:strand:- start:1153 stop:1395 length:243 start_codon:yes stop_codon:yes gene_type:complete
MFRLVTSLFKPSHIQPSLGRWALADNSDIKSALANIDCCGDKLCGDPYTSKQAIDRYVKAKEPDDSENKDNNPTSTVTKK